MTERGRKLTNREKLSVTNRKDGTQMHFVPLTKAKRLAGEVGRRVRQGNHEVRGSLG